MSEEQPYFRFNPGAYLPERAFERSNEACGVCARPCGWKYMLPIYMRGEAPAVCARCIADGRLAAFVGDAHFSLHDVSLEDADPALEDELLRRTPGVSCFNPFEWPVLDGKPLAFVGYGKDKALIALPEVQAAMEEALGGVGSTFDGPSPYALIFREIDGARYRVVVDLD